MAAKAKRDDLQGLRGIAILAVVAFHFFPGRFPNGYVGVDQFFVLSGFLMTMIFGSKEISRSSVVDFYYRRVKRIIPLYLLAVFLGLVFVFVAFPSTFVPINADSAMNSILLYSNLAHHSDRNAYFVMLKQAEDVFTHTWSLCVEMQFYVLAPAFFVVLSLLRRDVVAATAYVVVVAAASLAWHLTADSHTSFNNVFCRIWQFASGCAAFFVSDALIALDTRPFGYDCASLLEPCEDELIQGEEKEIEINEDEDIPSGIVVETPQKVVHRLPRWPFLLVHTIALGVVLFCAFFTDVISPPTVRLYRQTTSVFASVLIACGGIVPSAFLSNKHLVYLGDVSYSFYLVHWPIFVFAKHNKPGDIPSYILAILVAYVIAVVISESFEKCYLSMSGKPIFALIGGFYLLITSIALFHGPISTQIETWKYGADGPIRVHPINVTYAEAIELNRKWVRDEYKMLVLPNCFPNRTEHGYCEFPASELKGDKEMFVLGNSYTANLGELVFDNFKTKAKKMAKYSYSYCEVLTVKSAGRCRTAYNEYLKQIVGAKPDVLFIIDRHDKLDEAIKMPLGTDPIFLEALTTLQKYEQLVTSKIYLMDSIPLPGSGALTGLVNLLAANHTINDVKMMPYLNHVNGNKRMEELVKRCEKCELIRTASSFFVDGVIRFYDHDSKLGYFFDGFHLTPVGQQLIRHAFVDAATRFSSV